MLTMSRNLPRRVAWSSTSEFSEVFDLLFSSNGDEKAQVAGLARIQAWAIRSPSSFPPSIASTAAFLSLLNSTTVNEDSLHRRLAMSMAITRFVNGVVDPLQVGMFAKSIGQLAREICLPLWFVELRHRATHEDLPSEMVLTSAVQQALDWLYERYWLPTLQSISNSSSTASGSVENVEKLTLNLHRYKVMQKALVTDATAHDLVDVMAVINVIEACVFDIGKDVCGIHSEEIEVEKAGVEVLVDIICAVDFLVPRSIKKRVHDAESTITIQLGNLYSPLLANLTATFPTFKSSLLDHLTNQLVDIPKTALLSSDDTTIYSTLTGWLVWVLELQSMKDQDPSPLQSEECIKILLLHPNKFTLAVLDRVSRSSLFNRMVPEHLIEFAKTTTKAPSLPLILSDECGINNDVDMTDVSPSADVANRLAIAQTRMETLRAPKRQRTDTANIGLALGEAEQGQSSQKSVQRWQWSENSNETGTWKACPIGALPSGQVPDLRLICA